MTDEKELQEKMMIFRTLESRLEVLVKQRDLINNRIADVISTISSIDEFAKSKNDVLFKLGGEAYVQGNVIDGDKILVEIGAGIVLEKSIAEGKDILNKRRHEMEVTLGEIHNNISQMSNAINQLGPEINEMIQNSQRAAS